MTMEKTVDLCIVGGAGGGLSAAVTAAQHGVRKILLLEKMKNTGGCSVMSCGMMGFNTPAQKRFGVSFDVDEEFRKLMRILNWRCDAKLVRKWLQGSGENFTWLEELGMKYDYCCTESADPSQFKPTQNRVGSWDGSQWLFRFQGPALVKCLREACARYGIEIMTETAAKHLLVDETGAVTGVEAMHGDEPLTVHAGSVILATGSISSNQQLIARFYHEHKDETHIMAAMPHNTGDGLIMAEEIGAAAGRVGTLYIGPHNHYPGASELVGMLMRRAQPIKVNQNGERFVNEAIPFDEEFGWMLSLSLEDQPGKKCYSVMDQRYIDKIRDGDDYLPERYDNSCMLYAPPRLGGPLCPVEKGQDRSAWRERIEANLQYEEERGIVRKCGTLDEAAAFIGCDPAVLRETVEHYNLCCARGYDDEFLKSKAYLEPVDQPPYYVILGRSGIDTCLGGLKVDHRQRVLDGGGRAIPGLYAAGVMCSGWFNDSYCFYGSEMSFTIYSGRSAGREAAARLAPSAAPGEGDAT